MSQSQYIYFTAMGLCFVLTVLAWLRGCVLCANVSFYRSVFRRLGFFLGSWAVCFVR